MSKRNATFTAPATFTASLAYADFSAILVDRDAALAAMNVLHSVGVKGTRRAPIGAEPVHATDKDGEPVTHYWLDGVNPMFEDVVKRAAASVCRTYLALNRASAIDGDNDAVASLRGHNVTVNGCTVPMMNALGAFVGDSKCAAAIGRIRAVAGREYSRTR